MRRGYLLLAFLVGAAVLTNLTFRARKAHKEFVEEVESAERYVDMGIVLNVVRRDLEHGKELLPNAPPLTIVRQHHFGGVIDRAADPVRFSGPSLKPAHWYCSEQAEPLILHADDLPPRQLVYGSMGAGKTITLAQWLYLRVLEFTGLGVELGATAPTNERVTMIARAIRDLWPAQTWTWKERDRTFSMANATTVRLLSTHQSSKAEGSRVQGYTWAAHAGDELQDQLEVDGDIEARGRGAPNGVYRRFNSATAKDDPMWRNFMERVKKTDRYWTVKHLVGPESPFQFPEYWNALAQTMSVREYQRKVLAQDVAPDERLYTSWDRKENIRPRPRVGASDVTAAELGRFGYRGLALLMGHDPGRTVDVTLVLKAYQNPKRQDPDWWVLGEIVTERKTTEGHCVELKEFLRRNWNQPGLIHCDPHGINAANDDTRPDITVVKTFMRHGFTIKPAAYSPGKTTPGQVPREARIDLVNTLLCDAAGHRRLFIDCDDRGQPVAPRLVEALERQQRDAEGKAERGIKGEGDLTHYTCALGYALWPIEKPRLADLRSVG
jgi:hypothetical protein